ncbi:MAG: adenylate/guanylate cyclase domain-containing protein [Solirubrobacterales bacterium]
MDVPQTHYARSGDLQIAYQVLGEGPLDMVVIQPYLSNIEMFWELPSFARFFGQLSSFSRLILFDRRGSGMSDGIAGATPLEETIDDVQAVIDAVGSEQPVLTSYLEGCGLTALFAASHPDLVRALVLISPQPRLVAGPGYEWAPSVEERAQLVEAIVESWGTDSPANPLARVLASGSERGRSLAARIQRLAMSPAAAAAALAAIGETDVRDVLGSVQCPTLVLRLGGDTYLDERHSSYVAEHIPNADYVEVPGDGALWVGAEEAMADEIQHFLTGVRRPIVSDRVLATVLFTDIVGSTERAAELGDGAWRSLLERHDRVVREEVERHRGRFVKSLGDGALAVFDGPSRAISSAIAARDRIRELGLEIRAGLHTGECELLPDDDVGGLAVHIGARVSSLAGPGEVLVSSTVRDLVVGSGQTLIDRGEHELKGVPGPWRIFAAAG